MKKTLTVPLLVALVSSSAIADSNNQFYSRVNVNGQLTDEGGDSFTEIKSNNSWIGLKGNLDLSDGLELVYRLEWKMDITGEKGVDTFTERPQYIGLKGRFGEATIGRNFTALWMAQGKMDLFNHYEGDIKGLFKGENRLADVMTYTSPTFQNVYFVGTYQAEKSEDGDSAVSLSAFYGDKFLKKSNWFGALAQDFDVKGYDVTRFSIQTKVGSGKVGLMAQRQEAVDSGASKNGLMINYAQKVGDWTAKGQWQKLEDDSVINLGLDFPLSKQTKLFAWATRYNHDEAEDRTYIALGIEHKLSIAF